MASVNFTPSREGQLEIIKGSLKEYDYVRFTLIDICGSTRTKLVPARNAYDFMENGIPFYSGTNALGSNCELIFPKEVNDNNVGNVRMFAALDTFHTVPWLGNGKYKTAEVFIEPGDYSEMARIFRKASSRVVAHNQIKKLEDLGYKMKSGMEWEYLLLNKETEEPVFNKWREFHSTLLLTEFESWFTDVDKCMYGAGVNVQTMQTEYAFGQFEFNSAPELGIRSADNNVIFKHGMKEMALQRGWQASFMGKRFPADASSGAHFSFSLWDKHTDANAFYDESDANNLSTFAYHWIAGIIKHGRALATLCCPTTNCYRRLHTPWVPDKCNWGIEDRYAMLRVKNHGVNGTYMENRIPSSLANPYLIMAGTIAAGLDGVSNKLRCPEPQIKDDETLPYSLEESLKCLEEDKVMVEALGETLVNWFLQIKREADLKAIEGIEDIDEIYKIERKNYCRTT